MSAVTSARMTEQNNKIVPVRMKKKTLKKLTNAEKLEVENKKMEERLRSLRQTIEREKHERSTLGERTSIWQSGQVGAIQNHAKEHSAKNKVVMRGDKKVRVKFLTPDKVPQKAQPARVPTPHNTCSEGGTWAVQQNNTEDVSSPRYQRHVEIEEFRNMGPTCGQCEESVAELNCVECGEKYCQDCFSSFHRKGALKTHRTRPLTRQSNMSMSQREPSFVSTQPTIREESFTNQPSQHCEPSQPSCSQPSKPSQNSLWGEYDEENSAQSFAAALSQWRGEEPSTTGGHRQQTVDSSQTTNELPDITFTQNENLTYFDRILLKKCKDLEHTARDLPSREYSEHLDSPGELTISQLDFFNESVEHREPTKEVSRSSHVMITEVTYDAGDIEEESNCVVEEIAEENVNENAEEEKVPVTLPGTYVTRYTGHVTRYSGHVTIEELITPVSVEASTPILRDAFYTPATTPSTVGVFGSHIPLVSDTLISSHIPLGSDTLISGHIPLVSKRSIASSLDVHPSSPRCVTPPREDRTTIQSIESPEDMIGQRYTDTPISPLKRRMPSQPNIERQHTQGSLHDISLSSNDIRKTHPTFSSTKPQQHSFYDSRPSSADVVILSSQAWKSSFFGFLHAGLPGYTLPQDTPSSEIPTLEEEGVVEEGVVEEEMMLSGPPIWCPSESEAENEIFSHHENSITFSVTGGVKDSRVATDRGEVEEEDHFENEEEALALLSLEHKASTLDLTEHLEEIKAGTPEPVSLLTHQDRMSQLDMEARGLSPTSTPILTKLTVRQSLFEDFEEIEKQVMAGDHVS